MTAIDRRLNRYSVISADPAWQCKDQLPGPGRGATKHYKTMKTEAICKLAHYVGGWDPKTALEIELRMSGKRATIADDALLTLWRLSSMQVDMLQVADRWGFVAKSELVWIKYRPCVDCKGEGSGSHISMGQVVNWECDHCGGDGCGTPWFGMGRYTRAAHETCLIATRGKMASKITDHTIRSTLHAPVPWDWKNNRAIHSAKPEKFYKIVERLAAGPYLELFGRRRRPGWTVLGNQVGKLDRKAA